MTYPQADITVAALLEKRAPVRVLVVVARMRGVGMKVD
jgi:hypothetical protein